MTTGKCRHGEFNPYEGCPICRGERTGGETAIIPPISVIPLDWEEPTCAPSMPTALVKIKPEADTQVMAFYCEALKANEYAEARVISTIDDLKPATDDLSLLAHLKKAMEEKRKEYVQPLQDHVKSINDTFKTLIKPIEIADKITREKILAFNLKQKLIREEQEKINALRLEAAKKEMELMGELTESVSLVEVVAETPKTIRTELGSLGTAKLWKFEIINFSLLDDQYKLPDLVKIRKVIMAGVTIDGVRAWQEDSLRVTKYKEGGIE